MSRYHLFVHIDTNHRAVRAHTVALWHTKSHSCLCSHLHILFGILQVDLLSRYGLFPRSSCGHKRLSLYEASLSDGLRLILT